LLECGSTSHQIRDCRVAATGEKAPVTEAQRAEAGRSPPKDDRPIRQTKEVKTCISVKYRKYRISVLIDTGSDVSIAGENIAQRFVGRIEEHETKSVHVANNEPIAIIGPRIIPVLYFG